MQKRMELYRELGDAAHELKVVEQLVNVLRREGNLEEAVRTIEAGIDVARETGAISVLAGLLVARSEVELALAQYGKAMDDAQLALDELGAPGTEWLVIRARAAMYWSLRRLGRDSEAEHQRSLARTVVMNPLCFPGRLLR